MLLPLPAVRAALRLDTAEKRFAWAAEQLYGSLVASPAVAVDAPLGIPAKTAVKGIADPTKNPFATWAGSMKASSSFSYFDAYFTLPFDMAQYHRGVPNLRCIGQLTTDTCLPYVGTVVAGEPIPDGSLAKTVEQYLVEQAANIIVAAGSSFNFSENIFRLSKDTFPTTEYNTQLVHYFEVGMIFNRSGFPGSDRYATIGTTTPV
jgi:hypothetical protein